MELGFKLDLGIAAEAGKGGRIGTGVYKVEIVKAFVYKTENGNNIIDLELRSENGEVGFVNRLCIDPNWVKMKDGVEVLGSENFDYPRWQELAASAQMQSLTKYVLTRKTSEGEVPAEGIKELTGKTVNVAVYIEFDVYNNKEKQTLKLSNTFLPDGRSVAEAQAKKPAERIDKIKTRLSDFETDDYKLWKQNGSTPSVTGESVVAPTAEIPAPITEAEDDLFG